jgi:hypothetical protein
MLARIRTWLGIAEADEQLRGREPVMDAESVADQRA